MDDKTKVKLAFNQAFSGVSGEIVLEMLTAFCGNGEMVNESERKNCYMQGRFSVLREIKQHLEKGKK